MRHKWVIVSMVALLVLSVGGIVTVYWVEKERSAGGASGREAGEAGADGMKDRAVRLYFRSAAGKGAALLKVETRNILAPVDNRKLVGKLVEELKNGSRLGSLETIPKDARLREVFILGKQAVLDFTRELSTQHPGGGLEELATLYSIVNTVTANIPEIVAVHLLVEGRVRETLAGEIAINQTIAFSSQYDDR